MSDRHLAEPVCVVVAGRSRAVRSRAERSCRCRRRAGCDTASRRCQTVLPRSSIFFGSLSNAFSAAVGNLVHDLRARRSPAFPWSGLSPGARRSSRYSTPGRSSESRALRYAEPGGENSDRPGRQSLSASGFAFRLHPHVRMAAGKRQAAEGRMRQSDDRSGSVRSSFHSVFVSFASSTAPLPKPHPRPRPLQKLRCNFDVELRIARLDAQEEFVERCSVEVRRVEYGMIGLRQAVKRIMPKKAAPATQRG